MTPHAAPTPPAPSAPAGGASVSGTGTTSPERRPWQAVGVATAVAFIIAVVAGGGLIALYRRYLLGEVRGQVTVQAATYGQALAAALARRVAVLQGFENLLRLQPDLRQDGAILESYAAEIQRQTPGIRALQLVRGGRITLIAPQAGNEAAFGLDLAGHPDPEVRAKYFRSIGTDQVTLTGPITLTQGGAGLVIRSRFHRPGLRGYDLAALVLDLQPLVRDAGLDDPVGLRIAIRDSADRLVVGTPDLGAESPVAVTVPLPDGHWRLHAVPIDGWGSAIQGRLTLFSAGVILSGLLVVAVVFLAATRQSDLRRAVEVRTRSLNEAVDEVRRIAASREESEARLRQAQRLESLGRFAGGIAHDFNNLLTVIIGSIALARSDATPGGEVEADLSAAEHAAQRARELTRKLLAFARQREIETQVIDLNKLVGEMQPILRRLVSERIDLGLELAPGLWPVFGDPGQLEQVVTNLVVNAGDAIADQGRIIIRTWNTTIADGSLARETLGPGDYVCVTVEDDGTGMSPEVLQRAFDPFFTTKEVGKGTGLGLATVYGIARQAGGDVQLHSELGRGTRATIRLPRTRQVSPEREGRISGPTERASRGGESVLLVEDDASVRRVVTRILGASGYKLIAAEDGDSALRRLDPDQRIDLLVTDVVTPGLGGRALAERMLARDPRTRVLFISGYAADERFADLLARPGVAYLAKPFTVPQLQAVVRQLLDLAERG